MYMTLAPEPRDVHWGNLMLSSYSITLRVFLVIAATTLLLLFWSTPVFFLASLLSYDTIKEYSPWLAHQIDRFPAVGALVQNSLPSLAFVGFNALLPYILEALCYFQGLQAKSWIEYSLMKKYYLFLLITCAPPPFPRRVLMRLQGFLHICFGVVSERAFARGLLDTLQDNSTGSRLVGRPLEARGTPRDVFAGCQELLRLVSE
jgi:hypothetical protein